MLVTWLILDQVGLGVEELGGLDPSAWTPAALPFAASCALLFAGYALSAALWGRIVRDLGGPAVPGWVAVRLFMIANLGRYVPGKVWQIAGLAVLAGRRGVPAATATGAAVLGQGIALAAAAGIGTGALLGAPQAGAGARGAAFALVAAVGVGLAPPVFRRVTALWFRLARQEAPAGLGSVHAVRWVGAYAVNWLLYAFAFWVLAVSLGLDAPLLPVASAFAAAYVFGYVMIFAPAGVGVREGFLVLLLSPHLGAGPAGALAIVARLWTTAVEVIPAAAFWALHLRDATSPAGTGAVDG